MNSAPDLLRRNPALAQFDQRAQRQQFAEPVDRSRRDQFLLFPALELPFGNAQQTQSRFASKRLTHRAVPRKNSNRTDTGNRGDTRSPRPHAVLCFSRVIPPSASTGMRTASAASPTLDPRGARTRLFRTRRKHRTENHVVRPFLFRRPHFLQRVARNPNQKSRRRSTPAPRRGRPAGK